MNEEIRVDEINTEEAVKACEDLGKSGKGSTGLIVGAIVCAAAGVAAWAYKTKDKREEKKIEKLRKKGYVIYKAEPVEADEDYEDVETEE